jgi:hypothetical protein
VREALGAPDTQRSVLRPRPQRRQSAGR